MLIRILTRLSAVVVGVTALMVSTGSAWADPDPVPPPAPVLPNVNAYAPISPVDYTVMNGTAYAFAVTPQITCVMNRTSGGYGCSGPLPGAPEGANLISAGPVGPAGFSSTSRPIFSSVGEVKPLPPNTRLSFRDISCGVDGTGVVACINSNEQIGFVISPAGTFIADTNPLVDRPEGSNPYMNPMPG